MSFPYMTEYAKSNRSMCKGCKKNIGMGALRIAKMGSALETLLRPLFLAKFRAILPAVRSPFFDGMQPNWHHKRWSEN